MHAVDALQFALGDLADIRAVSAIRNPAIRLADTGADIASTAPDHIAIAARMGNGAVALIFYRGGTSRGNNFRWEINGSDGDIVLTSSVGNLQVLAPDLSVGIGPRTDVEPRFVPAEYDLAGLPISGPAANVARLYSSFLNDLRSGSPGLTAPDLSHAERLHHTLDAITEAMAGECRKRRS